MNIVSSSTHEHFNDGRKSSSRAGLPVQAGCRQPDAASSMAQSSQQEKQASSVVYPAYEFIGQAYRERFDSRVTQAINAYQAQDVADQQAVLSSMLGIDVYA